MGVVTSEELSYYTAELLKGETVTLYDKSNAMKLGFYLREKGLTYDVDTNNSNGSVHFQLK